MSISLQGIIQGMHRTIMEVIPLMCPPEHLSSMWAQLLQELIAFLPGSVSSFNWKRDDIQLSGKTNDSEVLSDSSKDIQRNKAPYFSSDCELDTLSYLFGEKLIPVLVELFLRAPASEREITFVEFVHSLGRSVIASLYDHSEDYDDNKITAEYMLLFY